MRSSEKPLVVFNAHLLAGEASYRNAGISVYITHVLRQLDRLASDLRYMVSLGSGVLPDDVHLPVIRSRMPTYRPPVRILWEQFYLPLLLRSLKADLLHAPAFVGPLVAPCPQVISVMDLSFMRHPELFRRGNRLYLSLMTRLACRRADAVLAISEFTAREVVSLLGVPAERVHAVALGVSSRFRPLPPEDVAHFRQAQGLPERFVLFMGTLEPRKNLVRLVHAFARLQDHELHLVLAGGRGWFYEQIFAEVERLALQDRVHFPGYVPAETQPLWYNAAEAFAYVSLYEGFGLPVLEALACGVPTLTGDASSLPEAGGDAALLVSVESEAAIAEGLARLLHDRTLRAVLRERGPEHAARFSWARTGRRTIDLYRSILGLGNGKL